MRKFYLVLSILGIIVAVTFIATIIMDLSFVMSDKESFRHIYNVSPNSNNRE